MARLGPRFADAFRYAGALHADQLRKGTSIPYVAHLIGVASLVLEAGGDEDQAIAALLHDAVEDQGGASTQEEIRRRFGDRVGAIVAACSDTDRQPKPPWRQRKETYLNHLRTASRDALLVSLADKVHNARALLADLRTDGEPLWRRFSGGRYGELWYCRRLSDAFAELYPGPLASELERIVREIERLSGA